LWYLAVHGKDDYSDIREFSVMRHIASRIPGDAPAKMPSMVLADILQRASQRDLSDYERSACRIIEGRRLSGGMVSDQWNALSAQVLIHLRGLQENAVLDMVERQKHFFGSEKIATLQEIPWFCFDMHTRPGQMAMRVWLKNYKTALFSDEEKLGTAWFQLESAMLGAKVLPETCNLSNAITWRDSQWLAAKLKSLADWYGVSVEELHMHWKRVMPKVKDLVLWAIKKSGE